MNRDGLHMGFYYADREVWRLGRVNVKTGVYEIVYTPVLDWTSHAMMSPTDPDLYFFSQEGRTETIPDRMRTINLRSGVAKNIFKQKRLDTGEHVEYVGHEFWSWDGSGLYLVKYPQSPLKPTSLYFVNNEGEP